MYRNPHISHQILSTFMQTTEFDEAVPFLYIFIFVILDFFSDIIGSGQILTVFLAHLEW